MERIEQLVKNSSDRGERGTRKRRGALGEVRQTNVGV